MNLFGIKQYLIALFPLSIIVLVFPMALPQANFSTGQALLVALISAAMYGVFLLIQTKTHQSLFVYEHEDEGDDDNPHHGKPSAHSSGWHTVWLLVHLMAVIVVTKMNASPLEALLTNMNAPVAFTGFLVALLILSPEGLGALKAVLNNQVQRAMNLFFGSVLATISLTVPVVTLIARATSNDLVFGLGAPEMVVMVASLVLCHISFSTGRTNVLNGAAHLALFAAYLMTILPEIKSRIASYPAYASKNAISSRYPARRSFSPNHQSLLSGSGTAPVSPAATRKDRRTSR